METKESLLNKLNLLISIETLQKVTYSNPIKKAAELPKKIIIEKIFLKNNKVFQITYFIENQVKHENISEEKFSINNLIEIMVSNFKQCEVFANNSLTILMNKKKDFKITGIKKSISNEQIAKSHNKQKNYILKDGEFIEWLFKLNVIDKNGVVLSHMQKKFRQINKFLELLKDVEEALPQNAKIIDMGCGKSYLTFAMYYYFNNIKNKNVIIKGYDLKKDVIENCNKLTNELGFKNLKFYNEDIKNLTDKENINMIISLHACDTATDYAIYFGVILNCDVILSVPCCQHEIFTQIKNDTLSSMLNYGILKERFSSILTDSLRADALKLCGYKTNIIEFIDMEHTPKNIMIKAIKNKNFKSNPEKNKKFLNTIESFNLNPTINTLLKDYFIK